MGWESLFKASIREAGGMKISPGMARHYQKMAKESVFHTCSDCGLVIGKYPGKNCCWCPNCGTDMREQDSYPSKVLKPRKDNEPVLSETFTLEGRALLHESLEYICEVVHHKSQNPYIPWSPNGRSVFFSIFEDDGAIFSVIPPYKEFANRIGKTFSIHIHPTKTIGETIKDVLGVVTEYIHQVTTERPYLTSVTEDHIPRPAPGDHIQMMGYPGSNGPSGGVGIPIGPGGGDVSEDGVCSECGCDDCMCEAGEVIPKNTVYSPKSTSKPTIKAEEESPLQLAVIGDRGVGEQGHVSGPSGEPRVNRPMDYMGEDDLDLDFELEQMGSTEGPDGEGGLSQNMDPHIAKVPVDDSIDSMPWNYDRPRTQGEGESYGVEDDVSKGTHLTNSSSTRTTENANVPSDKIKAKFVKEYGVFNGNRFMRFDVSGPAGPSTFDILIREGTRGLYIWSKQEANLEAVAKYKTKYGVIESVDANGYGEYDSSEDMGTAVFTAAVAIIIRNKRDILMGMASNKANDDRIGYLVMPGGHIDPEDGADPVAAATREAREEMGVEVISTGQIITHPSSPTVAFVICEYISGTPNPNEEFDSAQWVNLSEVASSTIIYPQNFEVIMNLLPGYIGESVQEKKGVNEPPGLSKGAYYKWLGKTPWGDKARGKSKKGKKKTSRSPKKRPIRDSRGESSNMFGNLPEVGVDGLDEVLDRIVGRVQLPEVGTSDKALNGKKIAGGKPASPNPRAKPGTSMKAPEKQSPLVVPPKKAPTLSNPTVGDEESEVEIPTTDDEGQQQDGQGQPGQPGEQPDQQQLQQGQPGQPGQQPGQPGQNGLPSQQGPKVVELKFGDEEAAQKVYDWLAALRIPDIVVDKGNVRVKANTQGEEDIIHRVASAFGMEITFLG